LSNLTSGLSAILLSIVSNILGCCTVCASLLAYNWKICFPSPCTRLSRTPWAGRFSCRLLWKLRCPVWYSSSKSYSRCYGIQI